MTDAEKIGYLDAAATYQSQYDALLRLRDESKAQTATYETLMMLKKKQLDDTWAFLKSEVNSGQ